MRYWLPLMFGMLALSGLLAQNVATKKSPTGDSVDKDYAGELPRIPRKSLAEAQKAIQVAPGFQVELVAAEPALRSPVAVDVDENGRMFVAEFPEYNNHRTPGFKEKGCIRLLEDPDGDGSYRSSRIYVDNLDQPVAVACWDGGVFVGAVPNVFYFKDSKGDGKVDVKKTIYTGFLSDKAGEAMLNSFRWGLENRFHISTSLAGGVIKKSVDDKDRGTDVRGMGFLFNPVNYEFEVASGSGQHGMTMDDFGRKFVCGNSAPGNMVAYDGRYLSKNPYADSLPPTPNIFPKGAQTKLYRQSPNEPWRIVRTRLRTQGIVPGSNEGGQVSGFFTGATGITVYRGDAFPPEYRGNLFVGEVSNNLVHRAKLVSDGVVFQAQRADEGREFLASTDSWFRPCQFVNAPDGTLWVLDISRETIETVESIPPLILKHLHPESGVDTGRIWRIAPVGHKRRPTPKLGSASVKELVALLEHPNGWHRDTASRLLFQRQDTSAVGPLRSLMQSSKSPLGRLHALYALDGLQALTEKQVLSALNDPEPGVREHALRLAERFADSPEVRRAVLDGKDDRDYRVRYQLAFTLGAFRGGDANRKIVDLAQMEGESPWFRMALLAGAKDRAGELLVGILKTDRFRSSNAGRAFLTSLASQIGASRQPADLAILSRAIDQLPTDESGLGKTLLKSALAKLPPAERVKFQQTGKSAALFEEMLVQARKTFADVQAKPDDRAGAVRALGLAEFSKADAILKEALQVRQPESVQKAALETLAKFEHANVPGLVIDAWPGLSPKVRATAAETLFARPTWIHTFLDGVEKGRIKPSEIDPARIAVLKATGDATLKSRAEKLFAGSTLSKRQDVILAYQGALKKSGDAVQGKALFKQHCSVCHRLEGVGDQIGAELNGIKDKGNDVILLNILDPNREVLPKFLNYVLVTDQGRLITGLLTSETATSITLRRADGTSETVLRVNIDELRSTGMSFMPEGLEKQIPVQGMADLLAYLQSIQ